MCKHTIISLPAFDLHTCTAESGYWWCNMVTVAKLDGKIIEIVRYKWEVQFSEDKGWLLINSEIAKKNSLAVKWVPITTQFDWVKTFNC
jgi:hypothetical protein